MHFIKQFFKNFYLIFIKPIIMMYVCIWDDFTQDVHDRKTYICNGGFVAILMFGFTALILFIGMLLISIMIMFKTVLIVSCILLLVFCIGTYVAGKQYDKKDISEPEEEYNENY